MYLNIGCGTHKLNGFINIDLDAPGADLHADVTQGLPYDDNSIDGIRTEHFIEHLTKKQAYIFFREARRVLKPGGVLRISTPDLAEIIKSYQNKTPMDWETEFGYEHIETRCEMLNTGLRDWGHSWVYDLEELVNLGIRTGFRDHRTVDKTVSAIDCFTNLDYRGESIIVEFTKSAPKITAQPLVSILIPAYNPRYFELALQSALAQTYKNIEIIVSDDSPSDQIKQIVEKYQNIRYIKNNTPKGGSENYAFLLELAGGDYIKYLNDDDILHDTCVEKMVEVLNSCPEVTLVTGYRQCIDESGNILEDKNYNKPILPTAGVIAGQTAYAILNANYIGEPTSVMFRKQDMKLFVLDKHLFAAFGHVILANIDMVMWLKLLSAGNLAYIVEPMTQFRQHAEQIQRRPDLANTLHLAYHKIIQLADTIGMRTVLETQKTVVNLA